MEKIKNIESLKEAKFIFISTDDSLLDEINILKTLSNKRKLLEYSDIGIIKMANSESVTVKCVHIGSQISETRVEQMTLKYSKNIAGFCNINLDENQELFIYRISPVEIEMIYSLRKEKVLNKFLKKTNIIQKEYKLIKKALNF